jgi:23S rRNA (pseudouridine1915-N3)-methyltransferase
MKINLYTIEKESKDDFTPLIKTYEKMVSKYAKLNIKQLFNKNIQKAQTLGCEKAQASYYETFLPYTQKGYNIVLDEDGEVLNSKQFSQIFSNNSEVNFFIGGAFGFSDEMIKKSNKTISLSKLTFAHKIAKLVLLEQVYRAFSIINGHPYHKE